MQQIDSIYFIVSKYKGCAPTLCHSAEGQPQIYGARALCSAADSATLHAATGR